MNSDSMDEDLVEELDYVKELLIKSGFFSTDDMVEILKDQFIDEDIDFSKLNITLNNSSNENFSKLENIFTSLSCEGIVAIHNCGYDFKEGIADAFELFVHLTNNNFNPIGFCFYSFEDVEEAVFDNKLKITFGDYEKSENKALEIGNIVKKYLEDENFNIKWDGTVNNQIEIDPFIWDKSYDSDKEYELAGAYDIFTNGV